MKIARRVHRYNVPTNIRSYLYFLKLGGLAWTMRDIPPAELHAPENLLGSSRTPRRSEPRECQARLTCNPSRVLLRSSSTARCLVGSIAPHPSHPPPPMQHAPISSFVPQAPELLISQHKSAAPGLADLLGVGSGPREYRGRRATQLLDVSGTQGTTTLHAAPSVQDQAAATSVCTTAA